MRTALYARVSTRDKGQDSENQLRQLRQFAATQGWEITAEYVDRASGKRDDRDQFQKMFAAASRRDFDVLLFWSLDRLSREGTVETLNHLQRLNNYGVNYREAQMLIEAEVPEQFHGRMRAYLLLSRRRRPPGSPRPRC